jgi:hypothetical protein
MQFVWFFLLFKNGGTEFFANNKKYIYVKIKQSELIDIQLRSRE